jgi:hypothetical protein
MVSKPIQHDESKAEAVSYCRVILIGKQGDKEMKTTLYVIYKENLKGDFRENP